MAEHGQDQRIAREVRQVMQHDVRLRMDGISVQVQEGIVTLTGTVGRYLDKQVAAEDAWLTKGVTEVRNQLEVQPDTVRNPADIAADLSEALSKDKRVNARGLVVDVTEGIVRLSGTVSSEEERRAAEEDALRIEGVVDISNELAVSPDRRRPDPEIDADVRAALNEDARLSDPTQIRVKCVAGTVRLEGSVATAEEKEAAEKDAWYTAGVVYVENMLVPTGNRERPAAA